MSESNEKEPQNAIDKITEDMKMMASYKHLFHEIQANIIFSIRLATANKGNVLQKLVVSSKVKKDDFQNSLIDVLKSEGLEAEFRNTVFHWSRSQVRIYHRFFLMSIQNSYAF